MAAGASTASPGSGIAYPTAPRCRVDHGTRAEARSTMREAAPLVSVIVLGYNGLRYVDACLDSLLDQDTDTPPYEVVFFDNASTDGTPEAVTARHPRVR